MQRYQANKGLLGVTGLKLGCGWQHGCLSWQRRLQSAEMREKARRYHARDPNILCESIQNVHAGAWRGSPMMCLGVAIGMVFFYRIYQPKFGYFDSHIDEDDDDDF